jgi:hypothetical protein
VAAELSAGKNLEVFMQTAYPHRYGILLSGLYLALVIPALIAPLGVQALTNEHIITSSGQRISSIFEKVPPSRFASKVSGQRQI